MSLEDFFNLISTISPFLIIKIFLLLFLFFYIGFAFVVFSQEKFMSRVVEVPISPILAFLTQIHLFSAIGLFILALIIL